MLLTGPIRKYKHVIHVRRDKFVQKLLKDIVNIPLKGA